jgi:hypothetical protein
LELAEALLQAAVLALSMGHVMAARCCVERGLAITSMVHGGASHSSRTGESTSRGGALDLALRMVPVAAVCNGIQGDWASLDAMADHYFSSDAHPARAALEPLFMSAVSLPFLWEAVPHGHTVNRKQDMEFTAIVARLLGAIDRGSASASDDLVALTALAERIDRIMDELARMASRSDMPILQRSLAEFRERFATNWREAEHRRRLVEERERLAREERERLASEERVRLANEERERLANEERERLANEERERLANEERGPLGHRRGYRRPCRCRGLRADCPDCNGTGIVGWVDPSVDGLIRPTVDV